MDKKSYDDLINKLFEDLAKTSDKDMGFGTEAFANKTRLLEVLLSNRKHK